MAAKVFLIFVVTVLGFSAASPTRRQYKTFTEATASDPPATNDGAAWDENDEFDLDGEGWFSQAAVSPSSAPQPSRSQDYNEYDNEEDYSRGNVMVDFGGEDDDDDDNGDGDEDGQHLQDAEEDDGSRNDSEFLFLPPRDTRLVLEDDDDDQSGPIKVRHTGRSSYPRTSDAIVDNSVESAEDDGKEDDEHPYEFTIDEDDKDDDDDDENEEVHKEDDSEESLPRHDDADDEDEFVSEGDDSDMFDNPEEEAAQVIYGDHVFLY